jgi:hypothetical protein
MLFGRDIQQFHLIAIARGYCKESERCADNTAQLEVVGLRWDDQGN